MNILFNTLQSNTNIPSFESFVDMYATLNDCSKIDEDALEDTYNLSVLKQVSKKVSGHFMEVKLKFTPINGIAVKSLLLTSKNWTKAAKSLNLPTHSPAHQIEQYLLKSLNISLKELFS